VKELSYDAERQMTSLDSKLASQDALRQRRGRAGRVKAGRCYKLITENTFKKLAAHSIPEMLRIPLDGLVLQTLSMELSQSYSVTLSYCIDPLSVDALNSAIASLIKLQAIDVSTTADHQLSALGRSMAMLPCSPKIGRLLVFGAIFTCILPIATAAALISSKSPYLMGGDADIQKAIEAHKSRYL
jgi:HrpA-like RNA helicase